MKPTVPQARCLQRLVGVDFPLTWWQVVYGFPHVTYQTVGVLVRRGWVEREDNLTYQITGEGRATLATTTEGGR